MGNEQFDTQQFLMAAESVMRQDTMIAMDQLKGRKEWGKMVDYFRTFGKAGYILAMNELSQKPHKTTFERDAITAAAVEAGIQVEGEGSIITRDAIETFAKTKQS